MYFFEVIFFVLSWVDHFLLDRSIYHVMTATQNNDSTTGRWKTEPKQDTLFLARNCRGCKLSPPAQTNKLRRSEENKSCFFVRSSPAFFKQIFLPLSLIEFRLQTCSKVTCHSFLCVHAIVLLQTSWLFYYVKLTETNSQ